MTRFILASLIIVLACTHTPTPKGVKSIQMHELWIHGSTLNEVVEALGKYSESDRGGIIYRVYSPQTRIASGHFFDSKGKLEEQFSFVSKNELEDFLTHVRCGWEKKSTLKSLGHSVGAEESGQCGIHGISYVYIHSVNLYEIRWKR